MKLIYWYLEIIDNVHVHYLSESEHPFRYYLTKGIKKILDYLRLVEYYTMKSLFLCNLQDSKPEIKANIFLIEIDFLKFTQYAQFCRHFKKINETISS